MKKLITIIVLFSPFFLSSCGTNASTDTNQTNSSDTSWNNQGQNQRGINTRTRAS